MKTRRHHNNKGYRQIRNGGTHRSLQHIIRKLKVHTKEKTMSEMTILDGLKKVKVLNKKIEKKAIRVAENCCTFGGEEPVHPLRELMQAHNDMVLLVAKLKSRIQHTNAVTSITDEKYKDYTIASLISHRQLVLPQQIAILKSLSKRDKERETQYDNPKRTIVMHYDARDRDLKMDALEEELLEIDGILDTCNMTTPLV